jgi:hypothetical protein
MTYQVKIRFQNLPFEISTCSATAGGSMVMLAKGNRSAQVTKAGLYKLHLKTQTLKPGNNISGSRVGSPDAFKLWLNLYRYTKACKTHRGFYLGSIGRAVHVAFSGPTPGVDL